MKKIGKIWVKSSRIVFLKKTVWQLICYVKCIAFWEDAASKGVQINKLSTKSISVYYLFIIILFIYLLM